MEILHEIPGPHEGVIDSTPLSLAHKLRPPHNVMHVAIERLYGFVMGLKELTGAEQSHLVRCRFCIDWLDACVEEKIEHCIFSQYRV